MEYTQNTYVSIIDTIRKEVGELAESLSFPTSRDIFREKLSAICAEYGCQFLGFNLIRLLHKEYSILIPDNSTVALIDGETFAISNISKPSAVSDIDKERYARILANLACKTGKFPMSESLALARFEVLLKENLYLEDDLQVKRAITRKDILNFARALALNCDQTNALLFKTLDCVEYDKKTTKKREVITTASVVECSVLKDTSAADLIERFVINNNESVLEREEILAEYTVRTQGIRKTSVDGREDNITQVVRDGFYEKVLAVKDLSYDDRKKLCMEYLVENARFLDAPNRTAKLLYEKLLCYVRNRMLLQYERANNDKELFDQLHKHLIKDNTHIGLSQKEREALTQLLLQSEDYDSLEDAYKSWAVPTVNSDGEPIRIELGRRLERILRGDSGISIQKRDILFALFLACSLEWEYDSETSIDMLKMRLNRFENLANELLQHAFLDYDQFYLPHPLEASIAIAIMCGHLAEGVFGDVTAELQHWSKGAKTNSNEAQKKLPARAPDGKQKLSTQDKKKLDSIDASVQNAMKKMTEIAAEETIVAQISTLASQIYTIWKKESFRGIDVYFEKEGTWGYIPITSVGQSYQTVGKTPEWVHSVLYGVARIQVPYTSRIRTGKDEINTLQNIIDDKLPELDEANTCVLHRKALMYLLLGQLQTYCNAVNYDELKCQALVHAHRIMKIFGIAAKDD